MQKRHIGIDFGTTNTAVYEILDDAEGRKCRPLGEDGDYPFSSIVALPKNEKHKFLFGRKVKNSREELSKTHHIITSIKSFLNDNDEIVTEDGKRYGSVEIAAKFLLYVKEYIKAEYRIDIQNATFSFPVDFKQEGRKALSEAAQIAGIHINGFISESTAAYIANRDQSKAYSKVLVLDWGGGTIDISLLSCKGNRLYEIAVMGEKVGGDDIDSVLAESYHSKLVSKTGINIALDEMDASNKDMIIAKSEQAKIDFESDDEIRFRLINYGEFGSQLIEIDYTEFCGIIKPIIERAIKAIDLALKQGHTTPFGVDAIIMVGGSSELRLFYDMISQIFGENKILSADKRQWSVANGAALIDISSGEYYLNDDICVELSDNYLYPILKKDEAKVGEKTEPLSFSLTEDSPDAHFIFKSSDGTINYGMKSVRTKGFLTEKLILKCQIDINQIANISIENQSMGSTYTVNHAINKLKFYYDLTNI